MHSACANLQILSLVQIAWHNELALERVRKRHCVVIFAGAKCYSVEVFAINAIIFLYSYLYTSLYVRTCICIYNCFTSLWNGLECGFCQCCTLKPMLYTFNWSFINISSNLRYKCVLNFFQQQWSLLKSSLLHIRNSYQGTNALENLI